MDKVTTSRTSDLGSFRAKGPKFKLGFSDPYQVHILGPLRMLNCPGASWVDFHLVQMWVLWEKTPAGNHLDRLRDAEEVFSTRFRPGKHDIVETS